MKIDGSCHCGAIAYEAEIDPETVGICHCTDCQQLTGTAFRVTAFAPGSAFRIVRGTPKVYVKTAESGNQRAQVGSQPGRLAPGSLPLDLSEGV